MTPTELRAAVISALLNVAPEADPKLIRGDVPLRDQLDIDSMDYLNFLIELARETGVEVPERDYTRLTTVDDCVRYLVEK